LVEAMKSVKPTMICCVPLPLMWKPLSMWLFRMEKPYSGTRKHSGS
jgi:hypothetical protein